MAVFSVRSPTSGNSSYLDEVPVNAAPVMMDQAEIQTRKSEVGYRADCHSPPPGLQPQHSY